MKKEDIKKYLLKLNNELSHIEVKGELCLYGTVMCLVFDARPSTKDINAIFEPPSIIRKLAIKIAKKNNLPEDWLNDGVKGFVVEHSSKVLFDFEYLKVYYPDPEYLLAMKALSARIDSSDRDDIIFLIKTLNITNANKVFDIIEKYYPHGTIKPVTHFFVEDIFQSE